MADADLICHNALISTLDAIGPMRRPSRSATAGSSVWAMTLMFRRIAPIAPP